MHTASKPLRTRRPSFGGRAACLPLLGLIAWLGCIGNATAGEAAERGRTQNTLLRIVPAPGKVSVDGRLNEWDRSGQIFLCTDLELQKERRSAHAMGMYDSEALYLALDVRDPTPLHNPVNPNEQPGQGWRGDCLQVRLAIPADDGNKTVTFLDSWYYHKGQQAALLLHQQSPEQEQINALEHGGAVAFRRHEDGGGYVQEVRLPWALLGVADQVEPGFAFTMGMEIVGGRAGRPSSPFRLVDLVAFRGAPTKTFFLYPDRWGTARLTAKGNLKMASYDTWEDIPGGPLALRPINEAESLIEPFFHGALSAFEAWTIGDGAAHGLQVQPPGIVGTEISWQRAPADGPALRMSRTFAKAVDISRYDQLLLHASLPPGSRLRLVAETDAGPRVLEHEALSGSRREYPLPLESAGELQHVTIEIFTDRDGAAAARLGWLGVQSTERLETLLAHFNRFDARWQGYLQHPGYQPRFEPLYGLFITTEELAELRRRHAAWVAEHGESPLANLRERMLSLSPEEMIRQAAGSPGRFGRDRAVGHSGAAQRMASAAIAALILEDQELLRHTARYAMAVSMIDTWGDSFYEILPGSVHDHRAFNHSKITEGLAIILDAAGELMTDHARGYLLRRIANDGVNWITYNAWRYEYIHHMNQLAWFSDGWLAGYGVLAQTMPRVKPYADLAHQSLYESMASVILPDGGYEEGPAYLATVVGHGGEGLYYYSRMTGKPLSEITPDSFQRTADFAEVIRSTDEQQDFIPFADSWGRLQRNAGAFMAALLPESAWVSIYRRSLARSGAPFPTDPMEMALQQQIPDVGPEPQAFVQMGTMGLTSSTRKLGDEWVKLLIVTNKDKANHNHEDKGSFVLEFAGQTFAADGGQVGYDNPLCQLMKHAQRHNLLLPTGLDERPAPTRDLGILPDAQGDGIAFHAEMDLSPRWEGIYTQWRRTIDSPAPDRFVITDTYALARGDGVEFCWNTFLPVAVDEGAGTVTITGEQGRAVITIPEHCTVRVDELTMPDDEPQRRIAFVRKAREGTLQVGVQLTTTKTVPEPGTE